MSELEQKLSDLDDSDEEFTCLLDPAWSAACPWEQELNPTNLSSQNRKRLMAMNCAFDVVYQCEWIMKNTSHINPDSLGDQSNTSDSILGADDRSPDSASLLLPPMSVESHSFLLSPKAHAQNPEPTPSQYLVSERANFPDEILADDERDDGVDRQQRHNLKRALSHKKSTRKNKAKDDHPLTRYTCPPCSPANVLHPQQAKGSVPRISPRRVQSLINLFEGPSPVPNKRSESFGSSDSAYESGTFTTKVAMSDHSGRSGLRGIFDSNDTSEFTPSALVKTSPDIESTIQGKFSSAIPLQTLHIAPNMVLDQMTVFSPTKNIALHRNNSHLAFLTAIRKKPAIAHKFYWTPSSTQEVETFNLGLLQPRALSPCYFHQDTDTIRYGPKNTVTQLESLRRMKLLKDDDGNMPTELGVLGCCAGCSRCVGSARTRQQVKIHQTPDLALRPPPRSQIPYPRPVRPPPRSVRPRRSSRPAPVAPPKANLSCGGDTVYNSMSDSDSYTDAVLSNVSEFFRHIETVDLSPAPSVLPSMSKEQILQITAKAQQLNADIRSLLVQLDDFLVQRQASENCIIESESGSLKRLLDGDDVTEHAGTPQNPVLRPTSSGPFLAPPALPPPRANPPSPRPPRRAKMDESIMERDLFSDTRTVTDVNADQGASLYRMPVPSTQTQKWTRAENMSMRSNASANDGFCDSGPGVDHAWLPIERTPVNCHDQNRVLCQAIVSQML
ncbi:hypothetical protein BG006_004524, partial [Podila minutissima]